MISSWQIYRQGKEPLPEKNLVWPFYGDGLESVGINNKPIIEPIPTCGPEEILVRVDALGLCASDAKMVKMGRQYPLFFDRDFTTNPARLGHEVALTVIQAGQAWQDRYYPGQRLGIQPNIYVKGKREIFGVNIPGGMAQYLTLGREVLGSDDGGYVFPVSNEMNYVEVALLEPWACVDVAYSPVRRLNPKPGGVMWIKGYSGYTQPYIMDRPLDAACVILTDVPKDLVAWVHTQPVEIIERNGVEAISLIHEFTNGTGFDDIILLNPHRAKNVAQAIDCLAPSGTLNLVISQPLDEPVPVDMGRIHYEHLAFVGCPGPDIAEAYGPRRNRSELRPGGVTWIVGAGGAMGRMHIQRALEMAGGPRAVLATNRGEARLQSLVEDFAPLAQTHNRELVTVSPRTNPERLPQEIERLTHSRGCDDIVVIVPDPTVIEQALPYLADDGMLVVFAGVRADNKVALPLDRVALHQAQFTGTSGSTVADEIRVLEKIQAGTLSPTLSVAAIGGLKATAHGLQAVIEGVYPGKVVIFPQLLDLPLLSLSDLQAALPDVYAQLGPSQTWTSQAEQTLFEHFL